MTLNTRVESAGMVFAALTATIFTALLEVPNLILLGAGVFMMCAELLSRWMVHKKQKQHFDIGAAMRSKTLWALTIPIGIVIDILIAYAPFPPFNEGLAVLNPGFKGSLFWLITSQILKTWQNMHDHEGDSIAPPISMWVIRRLRQVDKQRWTDDSSMKGVPPPPRPKRWYDEIETVEELQQILSSHNKQNEPGTTTKRNSSRSNYDI